MLTKMATCCYCGSRTVLELRGKARHELACASCGAPLRYLKMLPSAPGRAAVTAPVAARPAAYIPHPSSERKPRKKNRIKALGRKLWDEFWDEVEDVFD